MPVQSFNLADPHLRISLLPKRPPEVSMVLTGCRTARVDNMARCVGAALEERGRRCMQG